MPGGDKTMPFSLSLLSNHRNAFLFGTQLAPTILDWHLLIIIIIISTFPSDLSICACAITIRFDRVTECRSMLT